MILGTVFTTLYFLRHGRMGQIIWRVKLIHCAGQASQIQTLNLKEPFVSYKENKVL
jgi:hypothetical protein